MNELIPDQMYGAPAPLETDETVLARFAPDKASYWRTHAIMALFAGIGAGLVLIYLGNPDPWVGPVAAVIAVGLRGLYLKSEIFAEEWRLTARRILGPAGRIAPLSSLKLAQPFYGAVQIVTQSGDKHLIKYQADPKAVAARIMATKAGRA
ncbi:MAG: hypothetical protein ACOH2M_13100 [Cypionkella sp.]